MRLIVDGSPLILSEHWQQTLALFERLCSVEVHTLAVCNLSPRTQAHVGEGILSSGVTVYYRGPNDVRVPGVTVLDEEAELIDALTKSFAFELMTLDYVELFLTRQHDGARAIKAAQNAKLSE